MCAHSILGSTMLLINTLFLPPSLNFEVAVEEIRQQSPKRWRSQGRRKALGQCAARAAKRTDACRCPSSLEFPENTSYQKSFRVGISEATLGQTHTRAAQNRVGHSAQTTRIAEPQTLINRRTFCSRSEDHRGSLKTNTLLFRKTLQYFFQSDLYAKVSIQR